MSDGAPRVSVLMPAYDAEKYVGAALESVLAQTLRDLEVIAVDDGSKDRTGEVLRAAAARDPRVRVVSQENAGMPASVNRAASLARGPWLARMDADDECLPDRLERQVAWLEARPKAGVVGGGVILVDEAGRAFDRTEFPETDAAIREALASSNPIAHPTATIRREAFLEAGGLRRAFWPSEDLDLWLRISERHELGNVAGPVLRYRLHGGQVSQRGLEQQVMGLLAARACARARSEGRDDGGAALERITRETLASWGVASAAIEDEMLAAAIGWMDRYLAAGKPEKARAALEAALPRAAGAGATQRARLAAAEARLLSREGRRAAAALALARAGATDPGWLAAALLRRVRRGRR